MVRLSHLMVWCAQRPRQVFAVLGLLCLLSLPLACRVRLRTDLAGFTARNSPERAFHQKTQELFGGDSYSFVYLQATPLFTAGKLSRAHALSQKLAALPNVEQVDSVFTVTEFTLEGDVLHAAPLMEWPPADDAEAQRLLRRALAIPAVPDALVARDGQAMILRLRLRPAQANGSGGETAWLLNQFQRTEAVLHAFAGEFDALFQFGAPSLVHYQARDIVRDIRTLLPYAVVILAFFLVLLTGSLSGAVLPLLTGAVSVLYTLAIMGLCGLPITILTFTIPGLIMVIGSTEDVHLLSEYMAQREQGHGRELSVKRMALALERPVLFTSLTTFFGFLANAANPVEVIRQFGIAGALGLFVNGLVTFTLLPAYLQVAGARPVPFLAWHGVNQGLRTRLGRLLAGAYARPVAVSIAVLLPCAGFGIYGFSRMQTDNNIMGYFRSRSEVVQTAGIVEARMAGTQSFEIRVDAGREGAFMEPPTLARLQQIGRCLTAHGFDRATSLADQLAYMHGQLTGAAAGRLPESARTVAEYLLFVHPSELEVLVTPDGAQARVFVQHRFHSSRELNRRLAAVAGELNACLPAGISWGATGELLEINRVVEEIVTGEAWSLALTIALVVLSFALLFRSPAVALAALIPNLAPIGLMFGVMELADMPLNIATSTVASVCLGIAVDDTIHLMFRYRQDLRRLGDRREACLATVCHETLPVVATSVALALCFAVHAFSSFNPIRDFGILAAIIMLTAPAIDLLITPLLLVKTRILERELFRHANLR